MGNQDLSLHHYMILRINDIDEDDDEVGDDDDD